MKDSNWREFIDWPYYIESIMEVKALTQAQLAKQLKSSQQNVSKYVSGNGIPSLEKASLITNIGKGAGLSLDEFLLEETKFNQVTRRLNFKKMPLPIRRMAVALQSQSVRRQNRILKELQNMLDFYSTKKGK